MPSRQFEEKVRINRILVIDEMIRSGRYPNASVLADRTEVNRRTILRDVEYLRDMYQAPIEYDFKRRGYYYTEPNFFVKSVVLTEGELFSVALFDQLLEQYRNTPLEKNLRMIFQKILKSLPETVTLNSVFSPSNASFIPDPPISIDPKVFEALFTALNTRRTITVEYRALDKISYIKRTLDPYHAICQHNYWYILAFCHEKPGLPGSSAGVPRIYSFSRIKSVKLTGNHFNLPDNFDPNDYFDREMGVFSSNHAPYTFELLVHKDVGTFAIERQFHHTQRLEQRQDGSVYISFTTTQIEEVKRWVLGQGYTVKVLNPPELKKMVKDEIEKMRKIYQ
ncbi:helix-turn-helix transcriptional regulator [Treponema primitia]|uniref:helix-turn-helix transcriptional regulator n=1 Tax=Treponema primitia TaxID=88058 RepID=UPI000255532A|nr:WYL domain-containing protein [Treponema primitia]